MLDKVILFNALVSDYRGENLLLIIEKVGIFLCSANVEFVHSEDDFEDFDPFLCFIP